MARSQAALYVCEHIAQAGGDPDHRFFEADVVEGVRSVGLAEFAGHSTRICRPVGLDEAAARKLTASAIQRLGAQFDLKNVFDPTHLQVPTPPLPSSLRRRALPFGSGAPTGLANPGGKYECCQCGGLIRCVSINRACQTPRRDAYHSLRRACMPQMGWRSTHRLLSLGARHPQSA